MPDTDWIVVIFAGGRGWMRYHSFIQKSFAMEVFLVYRIENVGPSDRSA
jgi:hypothetical protein